MSSLKFLEIYTKSETCGWWIHWVIRGIVGPRSVFIVIYLPVRVLSVSNLPVNVKVIAPLAKGCFLLKPPVYYQARLVSGSHKVALAPRKSGTWSASPIHIESKVCYME